MKRLVLAGMLGVGCTASLRAQSVSGRVVDSATGQPVVEQWVEVRPLHGGKRGGARTDSSGTFNIEVASASDYSVWISLPDGTKVARDSVASSDFAQPFAVPYSDAERRHMYWEFQVDKTVVLLDAPPLAYPSGASAVGEVLVQYAVDSTGAPVMDTFTVLRTPDRLLSEAVRQTVAAMHFKPARKAGRPVRQLVQQPFRFSH